MEEIKELENTEEQVNAKKTYNGIGIGLSVFFAVAMLTSFLMGLLSAYLSSKGFDIDGNSWYMWVVSFAPLYLLAMPAGYLIIRRYSKDDCPKNDLGAKNYIKLLIMGIAVLYIGNIIGVVLSLVLSGGTAENPLNDLAFDNSFLKVLVMVILAPVFEEGLFRKAIIDRCAKFGEKKAIFFSALAFGLFHMNFFQFFYAFGLGLIFGYIYTRTRKIRYSISMHMIINAMGGVLAPMLMENVDMTALDSANLMAMSDSELYPLLMTMIPLMIYAFTLIGLSIAGLILIITNIKKLVFVTAKEEIPKGQTFKTIYLNVGIIIFIVACLVMFGINMYY